MKKRLLSLLLCAVMLFACAAPAFAARQAASINKVTPPELPVSEYPLIIVRGMQLNGMVRYGGTEKEEKASVNFNAADLLKTLVKIPSAFITGGKDKVVDVLLDYAYGLFGHMGCDENGDPSDPDVSMRTFEGSAVNYPDLPGEPSVRQLGLFTSALHHYGAKNLYFFSYDWRLDTYGNAALLAKEIDQALAETGKDKVNLIACSMGGIVTLTYLTYYGSGKINSLLSDSATMNGAECATDVLCGDILFDAAAADRYLTRMLPALSPLFHMMYRTGSLGRLCKFLNNFAADYGEEIYSRVLIPIFGTMPAFWELCYPEKYEQAKRFAYGEDETQWPPLFEKTDKIQREVCAHKLETLQKAMDDGMIFAVVANYNTPNVPVYVNAGLQGDGILETRAMSFGATVSEVGKTLSDSELAMGDEKYVSADGCINANTAAFKDMTWFIKDGEHICGATVDSDIMNFFFTLLDAPEQPTIDTWEQYPQFMQADKNEGLSSELAGKTFSAKGEPVC